MNIANTTQILIPILAAIASSYLTFYFTNRSKKEESIIRFKKEKYAKLLIKMQGFVGKTASGKSKREFLKSSINLGFIVQMKLWWPLIIWFVL